MRKAEFFILVVGALSATFANCQVWQHKLTVAANPVLLIDNRDIDDIVRGMNTAIRTSTYGDPWDAPCEDVHFVRAGDVILDSRLPITGNFDSIVEKMKAIAPKANVLLVSGIDCAGIQAAGCGRIGVEPLIVGTAPGFDVQLWLHERGHNVGLRHSAEAPAMANTEKPEIGMRFMFWMLGEGHVGKTGVECSSFKAKSVASVAKVENLNAGLMTVAEMPVVSPEAAQPGPPVTVGAQNPTIIDNAGLTPKAYAIVAPPWVHGIPVDAIKALSDDDLDSIRKMLDGPVNRYWPQSLNVLATVGRESDSGLIRNVMELPMAAVLPGADRANKEQFRTLLQVKLSAPVALGIIANRFQSASAVDSLMKAAAVSEARSIVGPNNPEALSKQALQGLSLANTPASKAFIGEIANPKNSNSKNVSAATAPLSSMERATLLNNASRVNIQGIEAYLRSSSGIL